MVLVEVDGHDMNVPHVRFLQGPDIPERQLYKEPPPGFLEADPLEVRLK